MIKVDIGRDEAVLQRGNHAPGDNYSRGSCSRSCVGSIALGKKGPSVTLSRSLAGLVRKLFEFEVAEIANGTVEIATIAREAGHRTEIAVSATEAGINAKGACIGEMGARVRAV